MSAAEAATRERQALDDGLDSLRHGWTPAEVVEVLADAAADINALLGVFCAWCSGVVAEPIRDEVTVSWLGDGAPTWCCTQCRQAQEDQAINADGNRP